ncbi:thioredoxin family protein [Methanogenium sp. S4BF]|uniref:thioredoxin family protein n=1 Tax=Methanogenium sp. S4BF TaxID=1789226 RepID=UPI002416B77E|nr:thioredoxin family protein [Methanogenium sp. S4BF]WFN34164.1 thioredoxin family protein [Methanogenium sp. S4BF]
MPETPVRELQGTDWEETVEKSSLPVAVMFYSPTCPHCRTMEPYFRDYAREYAGKMLFVRLNLAENPWIGERYGVMATPTFGFFCAGKPVQSFSGAVYPTILKQRAEDVLLHGAECAEKSSAVDYEISGYA